MTSLQKYRIYTIYIYGFGQTYSSISEANTQNGHYGYNRGHRIPSAKLSGLSTQNLTSFSKSFLILISLASNSESICRAQEKCIRVNNTSFFCDEERSGQSSSGLLSCWFLYNELAQRFVHLLSLQTFEYTPTCTRTTATEIKTYKRADLGQHTTTLTHRRMSTHPLAQEPQLFKYCLQTC